MSILNCWVSDRRALLAVDTHVQKNAGPQVHASKLLVLPHANLAAAMRGDLIFFSGLFDALHLGDIADFDAAAAAMPGLLDSAFAAYELLRLPLGLPWAGSEIALVGWSARAGQMQGVRYESWPALPAWQITPVEPWSLSPNASWPELPNTPDTATKMMSLARDQVAFIRSHFNGAVIGGRLLVADLTQHAVTIRTATDLEAAA